MDSQYGCQLHCFSLDLSQGGIMLSLWNNTPPVSYTEDCYSLCEIQLLALSRVCQHYPTQLVEIFWIASQIWYR